MTKVTTDDVSGVATTTLYLDGFQYQRQSAAANPDGGVDSLQFAGHEEGRARWAFHKYLNGQSSYGWEYDFFEKDHLGNTRVLLTQQKDTAHYLATMEAAYRNTEKALFFGLDTSVVLRAPTGYPNDVSITNPNDSVTVLNGSGIKQGPAIILKVMSGDTVDLSVRYFYNNAGSTIQAPLSPTDLLGGLAGGLFSITGGTHGAISDLTNGTTSPLVGALNSWVNDPHIPAAADKPKAYLNWILLDNQFRYVGGMVGTHNQSGALQVGDAGTVNGQLQIPLAETGLPISKSGYLYIYLSNVTEHQDVFFDNLSIVHYSGPMVEENHYYPFGLTMAGISDKAIKTNYAENKYRFNKGSELQNKEFSDGSGLELYETPLRSLDPQLGRWWQIDSKPDYAESPYSAMGNNPILHNDVLGDSSITPWPARVESQSNPFIGSDLWLGKALVQNSNVRVEYNKEVAPLSEITPENKIKRAGLKEKYREPTPQPMRSMLNNTRPLSSELNTEGKNSPGKTNEFINEQAAMGGAAGKVLFAYGLYQSATAISNSPSPVNETINQGAGWASALVVGTSWAEAGAAFGGPYAPFTSTASGLAGGAVGFAAGETGANILKQVTPALKDAIKQYNQSSRQEGCNYCLLPH